MAPLVAFVISLFVAVLGATGLVSPQRLVAIVRRFQSRAGLYAAAAIRLALGIALVFAAPTSRAPDLVGVLGIFLIVAGLITPLFGVERFGRILDWWSARGPALQRVWAACALAFGVSLAYAVAT